MPNTYRRLQLAVLLAVVSSSAAAGWVAIAGDKAETHYGDPATIRRTGNMVQMWGLMDFKMVHGARFYNVKVQFLSLREQSEYDCKEKQSRILFVDYHSGNMATGDTVAVGSDPGKWEPIPPGTWTESMWKFACGMKP